MNSIISLVGHTPLVDLSSLLPDESKVKLFGKLEGQNPGGSVKDRAALGMISGALKRGEISKKSHLVEATSGNTGIALAMIAAQYGIKITLLMPENSTVERVKTMRAYGAEVLLTPAEKTIEYSRQLAEEMSASGEYHLLNQFGNDDNWRAHYQTTGPEIWRDTEGQLTHFVSSMGTTGTITGTGRFLKSQSAEVQIVGVQPTDGSRIPGIRRWSPEMVPTIFDASVVDQTIDVSTIEATEMARRMASELGLFAGMSSGGAAAAALKLAERLDSGLVVSIVCDRGDRYLSSELYS